MEEQSNRKGCFGMRIIEYHDFRTLLGPCCISFSLPLLVPGVTLTVVGSYGNDNWFPAFGGWHVTGIVILTLAVLLLISGIVLKCCFKPIISADIEEHLTPTPSMITGCKNLGYDDNEEGTLVIGSTGSKLNNRVSPGGTTKAHTVVSTHEKRATKVSKGSKETTREYQSVPNGIDKTRTKENAQSNDHFGTETDDQAQTKQNYQDQQRQTAALKTSDQELFKNAQDLDSEPLENNTSRESRRKSSKKAKEGGVMSVTEESENGEVKTTVMTTVTAKTKSIPQNDPPVENSS